MSQVQCAGCGAVLRLKPKIPGICPYCGGNVATGRHSYQPVEAEPEPETIRAARKRSSRFWGGIQFAAGVVLIAMLAPRVNVAMFAAGMLAAHGLFRIIFGSGPNREDDDYDES